MSIGNKLSAWTLPRGAARKSSDEQQRLLKLYWNRAELKKELGGLDDQLHLLQDRLKQQEAATLRAIEDRETLETLLGNPELGPGALVHFQLRGLWRACHRQLQQFGSELHRQQQERERKRALVEFQQEREARLKLAVERLAEASAALATEEQALAEHKRRLAAAGGLWRYFKRRRLTEATAHQEARTLAARSSQDDLRAAKRTIDKEPLPEVGGLSMEGRRAINNALIAYAQLLYARLADSGLAERSRVARTRTVHESSYGERAECEGLMREIAAALTLIHSKQDTAVELRQRTDAVRRAVSYRSPDEAVPDPASVPRAQRDVGAAVREPNVLTDDYWDLYSLLLS